MKAKNSASFPNIKIAERPVDVIEVDTLPYICTDEQDFFKIIS